MSKDLKQQKLEDLYYKYLYERQRSPEELTQEEFVQLLIVFPALLVLKADGHVDTTELLYLNKLVRHLVTSQGIENKEDLFREELRHLLWNSTYWRMPFLRILRFFVSEKKVLEALMDWMISAASASSGDIVQNILYKAAQSQGVTTEAPKFISEVEIQEIKNILDYLGVLDTPEVRLLLNQLEE